MEGWRCGWGVLAGAHGGCGSIGGHWELGGGVRLLDLLSLGVLAMVDGCYAEEGTRMGCTSFCVRFELRWSLRL